MCCLMVNGSFICIKDLKCIFRPYLEAVFHALECTENDYETLFALCLLYAMGHNDGK